MKHRTLFSLLPIALCLPLTVSLALNQAQAEPVLATGGPTLGSKLPTANITLKDNTETEIRSYYSALNSLSSSELSGQNLLKNLKPILQNFTYYSYDNVWKIYEITDREWALSPAEDDTYATYNASTKTYTSYTYGTGNSNGKNNPYVHTLYRNRDADGVTVTSGRIREWGDHTQSGTNREHVWCQSRGFKASSGAEGPAGTDVHHLISGDGYVNQTPHNNNPYGFVKTVTTDDSKYAYIKGNIAGKPVNAHSGDQSSTVFEPQDSDKGDIARACFYMAACYNNISGNETITQFNPNLTMAEYATSAGAAEDSSATHPVAMGILGDLLAWHKLDPVDEYEIHRNNLIYNNYQHNRNPFIDFPDWVDAIWGTVTMASDGKTLVTRDTTPVGHADPTIDRLYGQGEKPTPASSSSSSEPSSSSSSSTTSATTSTSTSSSTGTSAPASSDTSIAPSVSTSASIPGLTDEEEQIANNYAAHFLGAFTCDGTGAAEPTFAAGESWQSLKNGFVSLGAKIREYYRVYGASQLGNLIAQCCARYDYVVDKYGYEDFMGRDPQLGLGYYNVSQSQGTLRHIAIGGAVLFGALLLGSACVFFSLRRKKEK